MTDTAPGSVTNPLPTNTKVTEPKVWFATFGSYVAGVIGLAFVNAVTDNSNELLIAALPDWLEPFVLPLVPAVVAFVAAWSAKHQFRINHAQAAGTTIR